MVTAVISILDDNGTIIGTYNQKPNKISYGSTVDRMTTSYEFDFIFVTFDEERRSKDGKESKTDL